MIFPADEFPVTMMGIITIDWRERTEARRISAGLIKRDSCRGSFARNELAEMLRMCRLLLIPHLSSEDFLER